jgi:hypothetical protein
MIELSGDDPSGYYNRSLSYSRIRKYILALRDVNMSLQCNQKPNYIHARNDILRKVHTKCVDTLGVEYL